MSEEEKEQKILQFIYMIITDNRNCTRYCTTLLGNVVEGKTVNLKDCIDYIERKLQ